MIPLVNLLISPTAATARASAVTMLVSLGIPANQWRKGGGWSSLLTVTTSLYASVIATLITGVLAAPFLPVCPAGWLPIIAYYVYGVLSNPATFGAGVVTLTNIEGVQYSKASGQAVFQNSQTKETYTNVQPIFITAGSPSAPASISITVQAESVGSVGNATAGPGLGSIDTVVTSMPGVSVVNPGPVIGLDADSPALIRQKCTAAIAARSYKGPQGAYDAAVLTAINPATGQQVAINRWVSSVDPATGFITTFVASPGGIPTPGDLAAVQANISQVAQPFGITATAVPVSVVPLSPSPTTITVWARGAGVTPASTILAEVDASVDLGLSTYPISGLAIAGSSQGFLYASFLNGFVTEANPLIFRVQGSVDVPLNAGQVAERTASTIFLVRQIP